MTSSTTNAERGRATFNLHGATSSLFSKPTGALLVTLLAAQYSSATLARRPDVSNVSMTIDAMDQMSPSLQVTQTVSIDLFDELLAFHERLALAQHDLPEDAARVLRDNLWRLYG